MSNEILLAVLVLILAASIGGTLALLGAWISGRSMNARMVERLIEENRHLSHLAATRDPMVFSNLERLDTERIERRAEAKVREAKLVDPESIRMDLEGFAEELLAGVPRVDQ